MWLFLPGFFYYQHLDQTKSHAGHLHLPFGRCFQLKWLTVEDIPQSWYVKVKSHGEGQKKKGFQANGFSTLLEKQVTFWTLNRMCGCLSGELVKVLCRTFDTGLGLESWELLPIQKLLWVYKYSTLLITARQDRTKHDITWNDKTRKDKKKPKQQQHRTEDQIR